MRWRLIRFVERILPVLDPVLAVLIYPAAHLLKFVRWGGVARLPRCRQMLFRVGVFPIRNHYYEPVFDPRDLPAAPQARILPGIDWNENEQLSLLASFAYRDEILRVFANWPDDPPFRLGNESFDAGDAEMWYSLIRWRRPRKIVEIGGGFSTLLARRALRQNADDDAGYRCDHVCIEPYEAPWLESTGVTVIRRRVQDIEPGTIDSLEAGDILFIDSSHVIRPGGDVVCEILQVLPRLASGVIVHIHDIFTPHDYPAAWRNHVLFWNEQYLVEAFLTHNHAWKIIAALNFLHHRHPEQLAAACPFLTASHEPASLYIQKC